jgi:hypothetical protein
LGMWRNLPVGKYGLIASRKDVKAQRNSFDRIT